MRKLHSNAIAVSILLVIMILSVGCQKKKAETPKDIYANINPEDLFNESKNFVKVKREFEVDTLQTAIDQFGTLLYFKEIKILYNKVSDDAYRLIIAYPDSLHESIEFTSRNIDKMVDQHTYVKKEKFPEEKMKLTEQLQNSLRQELGFTEPDSVKIDSLKKEIMVMYSERLNWLYRKSFTLAYFVIHE